MCSNSLLSIEEKRKSFGAELASKRISKGLQREDIAYTTRISLNFVIALEEGRFDELPGIVFGRGFVRNIARYLDLDSKDLIIAYDSCWCDEDQVSLKDIPIGTRPLKPTRFDFSEVRSQFVKLKNFIPKKVILCVGALSLIFAVVVLGVNVSKSYSFRQVFSSKIATSKIEQKTEKQVEAIPIKPQENEIQSSSVAIEEDVNQDISQDVSNSVSADDLQKKQEPLSVTNLKPTLQKTIDIKIDKNSQEKRKMTLKVRYPVVIRVSLDGKQGSTETYLPKNYDFSFGKGVQLIIFDASAVEVYLDDKMVKGIGNKGSIDRLSFQMRKDDSAKKL